MDRFVTCAVLGTLAFQSIHTSMDELDLAPFQPVCTSFKTLYENAAVLDFYAKNKNIFSDKKLEHHFFLTLEKTKKDSVALLKAYRKFYTYSIPYQPAYYTCLVDTLSHTHKILELTSTAIDKFFRIEDTEEYSKPLQKIYANAHTNWQEPLETLTYVIYEHVATLTERYELSGPILVRCALLQRVLAQSQARFAGYALDYD